MNKLSTRAPITILAIAAIASLGFACEQKPYIPPELEKQYQKSAHRFCTAIVECMIQDAREKLADKPRYRDHTVSRMDRDLCMEGQYSLIGKLSVDPAQNTPRADRDLYRLYDDCSRKIAETNSCKKRKELHREYSSCKQLRNRLQ